MGTVTQNGSFKNISSVKSDFLKSYITFYLMSCNTEKKDKKQGTIFVFGGQKTASKVLKSH